ncbi:MAG: fused MFS/spermidine synthase [Pseudomonadota bacterium]
MNSQRGLLCALLFTLLIGAPASNAAGKVVHRERSLYQTLLVTEEPGRLCLKFSVRREQRNQSCMNPNRPQEMLFPYTKMMLATLLIEPAPERILVVGLGGGTLPLALSELYPQAKLTVVEIDSAVVKVARDYFAYRPGPRTEVIEQDARVFTKRQQRQIDPLTEGYDLVLLDAFNGDYIPEHLLTREYLSETRAIMKPGAVLAANTFAISALYDHESTTYTSVFGRILNLKLPETGNRVIIAQKSGGDDLLAANTLGEIEETLLGRADTLDPRLAPYGISLRQAVPRMLRAPDWNPRARILTDQYAPANILNSRARSTSNP